MAIHTHILDQNDHDFFLSQGRREPVSQEPLKPGDEIVICGLCGTAYYASTWEEFNGCLTHQQPNNTLAEIPQNENVYFHEPVIEYFRVDKPKFIPGQPVTFSWSVKDATAILLNNQPVSGRYSYTTYPQEPGEYILRARNNKGWSPRDGKLFLQIAPIEILFRTNTNVINKDSPIVLNWEIHNAISASINNGVGQLQNLTNGSIEVYPTQDTVYQLVAKNDYESRSSQVSVKLPAVRITDFRVDKTVVLPGTKLRVSWKAQNAERFELKNYGEFTNEGYAEIIVEETENFELELTAFGLFGQKSHHATFSVIVAKVHSFELQHEGKSLDRKYQLVWNTTGFDKVSIDHDIGRVNTNGNHNIPFSDEDIEYTITGITRYGESITTKLLLHATNIKDFRLNQPFSYRGMQNTLIWEVDHAKRIEINPGIGVVQGNELDISMDDKWAKIILTAFGDINIAQKNNNP